jgi:DNA mismatch endonuclease (patch repair protein)
MLMDVHTPAQRSFNMSRIRSKDTKPELLVRRLLHHMGYRFRLHRRDLPGSPDVVLPRYNVLIYIHGCFWHRHDGCRFSTTPATNTEKWQKKFQENMLRDQKNREEALRIGWLPIVVWECETRDLDVLASRLETLLGQQVTKDKHHAGD